MRLRAQDLAIAVDTRFHDKALNVPMRPDELRAHFDRRLEKLNIAILEKWKGDLPWLERATTLPHVVCVGNDWGQTRVIDQNATLGEETAHALQWRFYIKFGRRYLFDPGFRFGVEAQAKCEVIWVHACQGFRGKNLDAVVDNLVHGLCTKYWLWRVRGKKDAARKIFQDTRERAVRVLSLTNKGKVP